MPECKSVYKRCWGQHFIAIKVKSQKMVHKLNLFCGSKQAGSLQANEFKKDMDTYSEQASYMSSLMSLSRIQL